MAQLASAFDPRTVDPQKAFEPLPRGDYDVMLMNTAVEKNGPKAKDPSGSMLTIELEVQTGPYAHRKLWDRITIENTNVQAMEIGQRQLSGLCHGVGWLQPLTDSDVLHGRTCVARVGIEKGEGQYQDKNKIVAYSARGANNGGGAAGVEPTRPLASASTAAAQPARAKKPWEK